MLILFCGLPVPGMRTYFYINGVIYCMGGGWINGYITARMIRYFKHGGWVMGAFSASAIVPGWFHVVVLLTDVIEWGNIAARPASYDSIVALFLAIIAIPAGLHGSYTGFVDQDGLDHFPKPGKTN